MAATTIIASSASAHSSVATTDGFVNLGSGPYPSAGSIAGGIPQPWYSSPQVASLFGGPPNSQQLAAFNSAVLQRVEQTFQLSGVLVNLTTDVSVSAPHTLRVVSNSTSIPFPISIPISIGTSNFGGSGFSFIDQIAKSAQTVDRLETIAAHNVSRELMLTFGVGEKYDQSGNDIDARNANLSMMINPNATFSPAAGSALNSSLQSPSSKGNTQFAQNLDLHQVPEPATALFRGLGLIAIAAGSLKKTSWNGSTNQSLQDISSNTNPRAPSGAHQIRRAGCFGGSHHRHNSALKSFRRHETAHLSTRCRCFRTNRR